MKVPRSLPSVKPSCTAPCSIKYSPYSQLILVQSLRIIVSKHVSCFTPALAFLSSLSVPPTGTAPTSVPPFPSPPWGRLRPSLSIPPWLAVPQRDQPRETPRDQRHQHHHFVHVHRHSASEKGFHPFPLSLMHPAPESIGFDSSSSRSSSDALWPAPSASPRTSPALTEPTPVDPDLTHGQESSPSLPCQSKSYDASQ